MILVTGVTGFVGGAVVRRLAVECSVPNVIGVTRRKDVVLPANVIPFQLKHLLPTTNWSSVLKKVDAVVHCAARVHVMQDDAIDPLQAYRQVNVQGTLYLARQAAEAGVRRFVFVSSIKVNGEATHFDKPFTADDAPNPLDAYGISKMEAEQGLLEIAAHTGMEIVIIRPPLVYGPGVKANFASMMRWLESGIPLPLGAIHNQRSLVSLGNLVDLILTCLTHPAAANQTFMVSDGEDVSTTELLRRMGKAMRHPARLLPVPERLLKVAAGLLGKADMAQRLCGSLQVDISKTCEILGWTPPLTLDEGLVQASFELK